MRSSILWLVPTAVAGLGLLAGEAFPAAPPADGYATEVEIVPDAERSDAFEARVTVSELGSGRAVAGPRVRFLRGPAGRAKMLTGTSEGLSVGIQVEVDEAGEVAFCEIEIQDGERQISVHKFRVRLAGREPPQ